MPRAQLALLVLLAILSQAAPPVLAEDWGRFRGPNGSGVSASAVPTTWSPTEKLKWKVELPGPGVSSPIVVGDKVFVSCYSGYGVSRDEDSELKELKRHLICFDKATGSQVWLQTVPAVLPEDPYTGIGVTAHGYASHTPVSDGERVYAFFGKCGVYAYDLDGTQVWHANVGTNSDPWAWGSSSSPVLYKDKLLVTASAESEALVALDCKTGKEVWRETAGGFAGMWGTPILINAEGDGAAELVMSVAYEVWSFDPDTGKLLWYCEASQAEQAHASAVTDGKVVYAFSGRGGGAVAVRVGGKDDVTQSNVAWKANQTSSFGSPILYDGKVYLVTSGVITTFDAETGAEVGGKLRLRSQANEAPPAEQTGRGGGGFGNADYASPIIADGKLYYVKGSGETFVVELGDELKQLSANKVTADSESFGGTPAISDGQLFLRSNKHLYCIGD